MKTIKKLHRKEKSKFDLIKRYYSILSIMDDWKLTKMDLELLSFTSLKGNISYPEYRDEFCEAFKTSKNTINNTVSKLYKKKLFIKSGDKVKVNPHLIIDPSQDMAILISLENENR